MTAPCSLSSQYSKSASVYLPSLHPSLHPSLCILPPLPFHFCFSPFDTFVYHAHVHSSVRFPPMLSLAAFRSMPLPIILDPGLRMYCLQAILYYDHRSCIAVYNHALLIRHLLYHLPLDVPLLGRKCEDRYLGRKETVACGCLSCGVVTNALQSTNPLCTEGSLGNEPFTVRFRSFC